MAKHLIKKNLIYASADCPIDDVIKIMKDNKISSILITDKGDEVVGIVTERDILRNLSTLDVDRKLSRPVRVIMTRPVKMVRLESILEDVSFLHNKYGIRHFPVVREAAEFRTANFVGMISTTDFFAYALEKMLQSQRKKS